MTTSAIVSSSSCLLPRCSSTPPSTSSSTSLAFSRPRSLSRSPGAPDLTASFFSNVHLAVTARREGSSSCRGKVTMMAPIGTPKVPHRTPGGGGWQWVDIWNVLSFRFIRFGATMARHCESENALVFVAILIMVLVILLVFKFTRGATGMGANSQDRPTEAMTKDPILQPNHKIFLSHSGVQKDFVEQLCEDLEGCKHFPFFDKRPSRLPKGKRFAKLILKAAKQCQLAVVVLSEDYVTSKWPMIELHAFVQASLTTNPKLEILPLFYRLSVAEFRDETRQEGWFRVWETMACVDERIKVNEWKDSLKVLQSYNGIEYKHKSGEDVAYRRTILSEICKAISPDIQWDDSHVQGRSKLCEIIRQKISEGQVDRVRKFGMYGVGGIGKTTACNLLCNELVTEFGGKVCCVEFGSDGWEELLKRVLKDLSNTSAEVLQQLKEGEGKHILQQPNTWKEKTFLAIDNVQDDWKSIEQAKMYLQAPFHEGSVVIVTSRSLTTLISLKLTKPQCVEIPELTHEDAKNAFLYYAAGKDFVRNAEDEHAIESCVKRCYFRKGDKKGYHYLPLALKALGAQLGSLGDNPLDWEENLPEVRDFNYRHENENPVFSILKPSFDKLQPADQDLVMDVGLYMPHDYSGMRSRYGVQVDMMDWLCLVMKQSIQAIESGLQRLEEKAWLEDVDIRSGRISMHDLYREFLMCESQGRVDRSISFEKRRWVYATNVDFADLERTPGGRCWDKLARVRIQDWCNIEPRIASLEGIDCEYYPNLVVLKLVGLSDLRGVLNLEGLKCLRSLEIRGMHKLDRLEGMEGLKNLTYFSWCHDYGDEGNRAWLKSADVDTVVGQFPASLQVLQVCLGILLSPDVLARCTSLRKLELTRFRAENLDISNCKCLESLKLSRVEVLQTLKLCSLEQLQAVDLSKNFDFRCLEVIGDSPALRSLNLSWCTALSRLPNLSQATSLVELSLVGTGIVLQEEDIRRLSSLPFLKPVLIGTDTCVPFPTMDDSLPRYIYVDEEVRIDFARRKVLVKYFHDRNGFRHHREEDLDVPPIEIRTIRPRFW